MDPRTHRRHRQQISIAQVGALLLTLSLVGTGVVMGVTGVVDRRWQWVALGCLLTLAFLAGGVVVLAMVSLARLLLHLTTRTEAMAGKLEQLGHQVQHQLDFLAKLTQAAERIERWSALSPSGREILAVPMEKEAFRTAIREASHREDWMEAERLIDGYESRFGGSEEVSQMRRDLEMTRRHQTDEQARARIAEVRRLIEEDRFIEADRALMTLREVLPNDTRADELANTLRRARRRRREALSVQWQQACNALDAATCRELLVRFRDLVGDAEMAELQETAATVERSAQRVLRDQFAAHVKAKRWDQALRVGDEILTRYPNSPMATEFERVRDQLAARLKNGSQEAIPPT